MLANFQALDTVFGEDHYEYSFDGGDPAPFDIAVSADKGKHKQISLVRVSADIGNAGASQLGLYNKEDGAGNQELFMRRESGGTVIQMSALDPVNATKGRTFLAGGLLMQWNTFTALSQVDTLQTFSTPFGSTAFSVVISMERLTSPNNSNAIYANNVGAASFNARNTSGSDRTAYYIAIGTAP